MRLFFCIMFLFFYVFNFNAIARENCSVKFEGLDTNKRSHLITPGDRSINLPEGYFECGVGEPKQDFCNNGQLVAVKGKAKIGTSVVENRFVKCAKTESGYEWIVQESIEKCTENDVNSIKDLSKDEVFLNDMENAEMTYVNKSMDYQSRKEIVTPIDDTDELCFAYMCKPDFVLYDGKCVYESDVPEHVMSIKAGDDCQPLDLNRYLHAKKGKYQSDENIKCIVTECEDGYEPDEKGEKCIKISEADTGSANTDDSQSDVGETNENPSPAFLQAMSELEEINKALDEVMKRLQEDKQVKNDNVT